MPQNGKSLVIPLPFAADLDWLAIQRMREYFLQLGFGMSGLLHQLLRVWHAEGKNTVRLKMLQNALEQLFSLVSSARAVSVARKDDQTEFCRQVKHREIGLKNGWLKG